MRSQVLCGAIVILASAALTACEPYGYGPYGYGAYGPYGYGANGRYGYGAYGPYGGYPPPPAAGGYPPPPATYAAPPPPAAAVPAPPATYTAPPPAAAVVPAPAQTTGPVAVVPVPCRKGVLWPFVREPGDCPTDAEKFSQYPFTDYPLIGPQ